MGVDPVMPNVIAKKSQLSVCSSDTLADFGENQEDFVQLEMRTCDGGCRDVFTVDELTTFEGCCHAVCGFCLSEITIMETPAEGIFCPIGPCRYGKVNRNVDAKLEYMFLKQTQYEKVVAEIKEMISRSSDISCLPSMTLSSEETGLSSASSYLEVSELQSALEIAGDFEGTLIDPQQCLVVPKTVTEALDTSNDIYSTSETGTFSDSGSETTSSNDKIYDSNKKSFSNKDWTLSVDNKLLEKHEAYSCATALSVSSITDERTVLLTSKSLMSFVPS